ncbi:hypothetical protein [Bacillus pumilus]|uniref:hypothetical protein n=1 Tax=Bacillus pumilus TaxID=1408 RepID=UPI0033157551
MLVFPQLKEDNITMFTGANVIDDEQHLSGIRTLGDISNGIYVRNGSSALLLRIQLGGFQEGSS